MQGLDAYEQETYLCCRCSSCKFVALPVIKSHRFSNICPSIEDRNFHVYSGGGKLALAHAMIHGRVDYTEGLLDAVYRCTLGGACDVQCRLNMGNMISVNEILHAMRAKCVEDGEILPEHLALFENLRREDNPFGDARDRRGKWADGLGLKDAETEKVEVLFHAGCRLSYDEELRQVVRGAAGLLKEAGVEVGTSGKAESCCGLRAFEIGFVGEMEKYAEDMAARAKNSGASILVTLCAECYSAFVFYYPWIGVDLGVEVLHVSQLLERLVQAGQIRPKGRGPVSVTYHDPCHLGRLGEPYVTARELQAEAMKVGLTCHVIGAGCQHSVLASSTSGWGMGVTSNTMSHNSRNLLGFEWVLPSGEVIRVGPVEEGSFGDPGPGLRGCIRGYCGHTGGIGVFTKVAVKLYPWPDRGLPPDTGGIRERGTLHGRRSRGTVRLRAQ